MSRKKRYIRDLSKDEMKALKAGMKSDKGYQYTHRCHALLLSHKGHSVTDLKSIFSVTHQTVYSWFDSYEESGIIGLENKPGRGRKAVLRTDNKEHVKAVEKTVEKVAKNGGNLLAEIEKELDLTEGLSQKMLRCFLKKLVSYGNDVEEVLLKNQIKP